MASDHTLTNDTPSVLTFAPDTTIDTGAAIDLGPDGKFKVAVSSAVSSLKLYVDVLGYFTPGTDGSSFHPISNRRVWDSSLSSGGSLQPNEERTIRITGNGGIPSDPSTVDSVALGLIVRDWTQPGAISVVNADLEDSNGTSNIRWTDTYSGVAKQTTAFVETTLDGTVTIRNTSSGTVNLFINAQGWFELIDPVVEGSASGEPAPAQGTINVKGVLLNQGAPVRNGKVLVKAWPNEDYAANIPDDAVVPFWNLGTAETDSAGNFTRTFGTSDLPSQFRSSTGDVNVTIDATDGRTTMQYSLAEAPQTPTTAAMSSSDASASTTVDDTDVVLDLGSETAIEPQEPSSTRDRDADPASASILATQSDATFVGTQPETTQSSTARSTSPADDNTKVRATLKAYPSGMGMPKGDEGVCGIRGTSKYLKEKPEKFGSVYNWKGARVEWTQTLNTRHSLGVAIVYDDRTTAKGGSARVGLGSDSSVESGETRVVYNRTYWNSVNYRWWKDPCGFKGEWRPSRVYDIFIKSAPSAQQTWRNSHCKRFKKGESFWKSTMKSYTKFGGVDLGFIAVDAQSGYDDGTKLLFRFSANSWLCGNTDVPPGRAKAVRAFKR